MVVLHDLVLHHLIVEMTLARGDVDGYVAAMEANHGAAGAAWARGRAAGMHTEMANFLMPASVEVANRSKAVIVHNRYAADRLRSFGVTTPIQVVPHPYVPETRTFDRDALRARLGLTGKRVIGFFGFLTSAKRAEVVLEAFRIARARDPRLELLIVGEPAPNIDVEALRGEGIVLTGYVDDDEFPRYYAIADRFVNLRYPSAGETSGTLIRALAAGKPVAVSDYAQFAELPDDCVVKIPFDGEVDALAEFFAGELPDMAAAQRRWLEENATVDIAAEGYLKALSPLRGERVAEGRVRGAIPLFPKLTATRNGDNITLRNVGDITLRARTYGEPGYRLIANGKWLQLPRDLAPGEEVTLTIPQRVRLHHALESIPMLDAEPFDAL